MRKDLFFENLDKVNELNRVEQARAGRHAKFAINTFSDWSPDEKGTLLGLGDYGLPDPDAEGRHLSAIPDFFTDEKRGRTLAAEDINWVDRGHVYPVKR